MAFTITQIANPNSKMTEFPLGPWKVRVMDLTFDNSYDNTNGEVLTAASLGWNTIEGAMVLGEPWSGTTTDFAVVARPVATAGGTSISFRAFRYDGANAGKASLEEVANAVDLSTYTMRVMVMGN